MDLPAIGQLRRARLFLKTTAVIVTVAFLGLYLEPLALAAQLPARTPESSPRAPSDTERLSQTIDTVEAVLGKLEDKSSRHQDVSKEKQDLRTLRTELDGLDQKALQDFDAIERHIQDKKLPQVILDRQAEAVKRYKSEMAALKADLDDLDKAKDDTERYARAKKVNEHLKVRQKKWPKTPVGPNNLPFSTPDGKVRKPAERKEDFQKLGLVEEKRVQVASIELMPSMLLPAALLAAPSSQDLSSTEDVQITDDIRALAQSLNNNPVKIYNWVRNNIYFVPTYGSIQGSQMCLENQRCNASDTASLLIALLRAANIPARYVYGTVQIPADKVMNWVGGVTKAEVAQDLLGQGGIPNAAVVQGGRITSIRMEHVWVEAWVDFVPSRGAIHKQGDTWVPMDASFKQYQYTPGLDIKTNVPFDAQQLLSQIQATATINATEGWVQGVNTTTIQSTLNNYLTQVQNYIDNTKPNATVGDVLGDQKIVPDNQTVLAISLPYQTIATAGRYATLPATLRHSIQFAIYASDLDKALDNPSLSFTESLLALADKKVALAYDSATAADQSVIDDAIASGATSLPAYLIHVKPVLRIESAVVATGVDAIMGDKQILTVTVTTPWYSRAKDYKLTAGDINAIGINPSGITSSVFDKRIKQHDLSKGKDTDFTTEMFYQIVLAWWGEKYAFNQNIGDVNNVRTYQLPSHAIAGAPLSVRYFFGIARSAYYASRVLDGKEDLIIAQHVNGDIDTRRQFMLAAGQVGSFLEGNVFEQAFLIPPGQAISTVSAWKLSNDQNVPIYTITQSNAATALPQIATDADAKNEMADALAAGLRVTVPKQDISVGNFTGTGYFIEDPVTGAGVYQITGGRSGGSSPAPQNVFAVPQAPATPIIGLMVGSSLRSAGAKIAVDKGMIVGIVLPAVAVGAGSGAAVLAALILAAIILILMIIQSINKEIDRRYPPTNIRLRHYTSESGVLGIVTSKFILETVGGTFGNGVYFADANDEDQRGAGCPPNSADIESRFQIPPRAEPISGFVEVIVTRANYYAIDDRTNNVGQREIIITAPLAPTPIRDQNTGELRHGLYIGPFAFGLEQGNVCF